MYVIYSLFFEEYAKRSLAIHTDTSNAVDWRTEHHLSEPVNASYWLVPGTDDED